MTQRREQADEAKRDQQDLAHRQMQERADLCHQVFGNHKATSVQAQVARWQERAEAARRDLAAIEALPVGQAAQLVSTQQEAQAQREAAESAARQSSAARLHDYTRQSLDHGPTSPEQELGL